MINLDGSIENADWLKHRSWDMPTTLGGLLDIIGTSSASIEHYLTLPSSKAMPEGLQARLMKYLKNAKEAEGK